MGVISSSGFSNTADEMDEAEHQLMKRVISPKQNFVIDSVKEVLEYFNVDIHLGFIPLTEKEVVEDEEEEKEVVIDDEEEEVKLSSDCSCEKKTLI